jgi:hypothetical protein
MLSGYFEGLIMNRYGSYNVPSSAFKYIDSDFNICTRFQDNNLDGRFKFCHYLLYKMKCWVIYPHLEFWSHFQKQIWKWGLGFCLEDQGEHHNKPDQSISYHTIICSNTFHIRIYANTTLGKIGHSRGYG